jgi:hypothetical protein
MLLRYLKIGGGGFLRFIFDSADHDPPRTHEDGQATICVVPLFGRPRSSLCPVFRRRLADQGDAGDPS